MLRGFLSIIVGGGIIAVLVSCGPEHIRGIESDEGPGATGVPIPQLLEKPGEIVFADVQAHVLNNHCISCHSSENATAGVDLTTYSKTLGEGSTSTVKPFSPQESSLYDTLIVPTGSRHMPPFNKPQLNEDQINLVYQWILNGAKEEKTQVVERPQSLQEELQVYFDRPQIIDYKVVNKYVFEDSCNKCHSYNGASSNIDNAITYGHNTTTYQDVIANDGAVFDRRGKPKLENFLVRQEDGSKKLGKGSRLYKSIAITQSMPPPKDGYKPMDSLRVKLLKFWLVNCAIEDYSAIDPTQDDLKDEPDKKGQIRNCPRPPAEE